MSLFAKEETNKLTSFEVGRARWAKLEELAQTGELKNITNRKDLAIAVGMPEDKAELGGSAYIANLIKRKYIGERLVGVANGKYVFQYSVIKKPKFSPKGKRKRTQRAKVEKSTQPTLPRFMEVMHAPQPVKETRPKAEIQIKYGNITITVDGNASTQEIVEIVKKLNEE